MIAADNGNLKLDTGTLGFSDIAGKDKEHGYYLNVGGSYSKGGGGAQDSSQVGKGEKDKKTAGASAVGSMRRIVSRPSVPPLGLAKSWCAMTLKPGLIRRQGSTGM
nr:hypothetical protein GCM10020185_21390 [Pseudomonas brassicacearum subsp. brassicacearum]